MKKKLKNIPKFRSDKEAENFVANADLTQYDLSEFKPVKFEFSPKSAKLNMRISEGLLAQIKSMAKEKGVPYTRYVREVLESHISG